MKTLTTFITIAALALGSTGAWAATTCAGETESGKIVTMTVLTAGSDGHIRGADITVEESDGKLIDSFKLKKEDIIQYFEGYRSEGQKILMVGLHAYSDEQSYPAGLSYIGTDFSVSTDRLKAILKDKNRKKEANNHMRVGTGKKDENGISIQFKFTDVVCSGDLDA